MIKIIITVIIISMWIFFHVYIEKRIEIIILCQKYEQKLAKSNFENQNGGIFVYKIQLKTFKTKQDWSQMKCTSTETYF